MIAISNAISIGLNRLGGGGPDPDAQAFFSRVAAAGGVLTEAETTAVNQLVIDMKANGTWTAMKAIYPMVGSSAAACAQNLKSSSFTGTFSSGWTFSSSGATPNGTSAFMDTGLNDNTELSLNSAHLSYYSRTNLITGGNKAAAGCYDAPSVFVIQPKYTDGKFYGSVHSPEINVLIPSTQGNFINSRTASNSLKSYFNNSILVSGTTASISKINRNIYVGAVNGPSLIYGGFECAFSSIGDGLSDTQAYNFYTSVQIFNTTLNRSVGTPTVSDADAQAFFSRVIAAGGTLTTAERNAVNQLVLDLKANSLWTPMKAIYPMVGSSAAACAQNLKSSSFTGAFSSGWTFASTGATPNGTSAYMNTGLNPNNEFASILSAHISIYSRTQVRGGIDLGVVNGGAEMTLTADLNLSVFYAIANIGTTNAANITANTSIGFFLGNRQSSTNIKVIQNTTTLATQTNASTNTKPNANVWLAAQNNNGVLNLPTSRQNAFASIGDGLTDTQATALYNAVQTMNTTLSRQV